MWSWSLGRWGVSFTPSLKAHFALRSIFSWDTSEGPLCLSCSQPSRQDWSAVHPPPIQPRRSILGKIQTHARLWRKHHLLFSPLDLCPHPERKTTYGLIIAVNTTTTVVQLLLCVGHRTHPFLRLRTLTIASPTPTGLLTSSCYRCRNPVERVQNRQATSQWGRSQA